MSKNPADLFEESFSAKKSHSSSYLHSSCSLSPPLLLEDAQLSAASLLRTSLPIISLSLSLSLSLRLPSSSMASPQQRHVCVSCSVSRERSEYSSKQWKRRPNSRCKVCVSSPSVSPSSSSLQQVLVAIQSSKPTGATVAASTTTVTAMLGAASSSAEGSSEITAPSETGDARMVFDAGMVLCTLCTHSQAASRNHNPPVAPRSSANRQQQATALAPRTALALSAHTPCMRGVLVDWWIGGLGDCAQTRRPTIDALTRASSLKAHLWRPLFPLVCWRSMTQTAIATPRALRHRARLELRRCQAPSPRRPASHRPCRSLSRAPRSLRQRVKTTSCVDLRHCRCPARMTPPFCWVSNPRRRPASPPSNAESRPRCSQL